MDSKNCDVVKVFLWTLPRSLSTVLCRCLSAIDGVQIAFEPYRTAYHDGPDANKEGMSDSYLAFRQQAKLLQMSFPNAFPEETCTFSWVKQMMEETNPSENNVIFAKDFAYCIHGKYDALPSGYRHAFLIRHPHRVLPSFKKMKMKQLQMDDSTPYEAIPECLRPPQHGYKEMYELYQYVQDQSGIPPLIIDADDMQRHPGSVLRQFCSSLGIPFAEKHLQWNEGEDFINDWIISEVTAKGNALQEGGFFSTVMRSSGVHPPSLLPLKETLSGDLYNAIDVSMPYYQKLYSLRLKPYPDDNQLTKVEPI